jgi:hypothetical protein
MAGSTIVKGLGRTDLFNQRNLSVTAGSVGLVIVNAAAYSRFTGFVSDIGSMTARVRFGPDSANFFVSSTFTVNSGPQTFDLLNLGKFDRGICPPVLAPT